MQRFKKKANKKMLGYVFCVAFWHSDCIYKLCRRSERLRDRREEGGRQEKLNMLKNILSLQGSKDLKIPRMG
jgi:hypothetical protein